MTQAYKKHLLKMLLFLVVCSLAVSVVAELSQRTTQDACDIQTTVTSEDVKHPTLRLDPWDVPLVVTSAAGGLDTAAFGAAANATDDFDTFWDEPEPPQPPFSPVVQAWFFHPGSVVCAQNVSFQGFTDALTWELCLAVDITNVSTTSLVSLSWQATDIAAIPSEYYVQLCNDTTILNMRTQTSMTLLAVTDVYTYSLRVWKDVSPPAITMVSATPSSQVIDGAVNITANVTDYSGVDTVTVLVISPDLVVQNQSMTHLTPGDLYSYNTTYHDVGVYQYHIWAKDTWGNAVDSAVAFFEIVNTPPVMASVRITPDPAYDDDDLQGYANATDADDHPVIYEWTWYRNDTEACSGVADNYNISFVGHRYDTGDGYFVWNDGTYTYLANSWGGLSAYTFDGSSFSLVATATTSGNGFVVGVWGDGTYIYVANWTSGITAYTFNGVTFTKVGQKYNAGAAWNVWGDGTYLYLANYNDGLRAYTFDGTTFTLKGHINNGGYGWGVWGDGTYLYLANNRDGVRAYTFDGATFTNVGYVNDSGVDGAANGVWGDGTYLYLANSGDGIRAYTFDGTTFSNVGHVDDGGHAYETWGDGRYVYVANGEDGIRAYRFNGSHFTTIGHYNHSMAGSSANGVVGDGTYVYLANGIDGLRAYAPRWGYPTGVEVQVSTINHTLTLPGENWTLSCRAFDGMSYAGVRAEDTVLIQPAPAIVVDVDVFLEGPFNGATMDTTLNSEGFLPLTHPYSGSPWFYTGTENVTSIPSTDIVDWVLVELRDASSAASATETSIIARQAAFLLSNASIVGLDGSSRLEFKVTLTNNLYVVVWHRNHLGVMTAEAVTLSGGIYHYDFSSSAEKAYGGSLGHKEIGTGVWGMVGGDGNADSQVNNGDKNDIWSTQAGMSGYRAGDFDLNGQVQNQDKNEIWVPNSGRGCQVPTGSLRRQDVVHTKASLAPQLSWRFTNPQVIPGSPSKFVFDVEMKCNTPGTFHRDLQVYFNYNTAAFGSTIVANGKISLADLFLMGNRTTYYYYVNYPGTDNSPSRYAILTANTMETSQPGSPVYFTEVPTSWTGLIRFTINITDPGQLAGISFQESTMNTGQYYQNTSVPGFIMYMNPSLYDNTLTNEPLTGGVNIYVDDDRDAFWYDATHVRTIQEAVDNASAGGMIYVFNGVYVEDITVNKPVTLQAQSTDVIVVPASQQAFLITADEVTITGFTITGTLPLSTSLDAQHSTFTRGATPDTTAIKLSSAEDCVITDNFITDLTYGLWLTDSTDNLIANNYVDATLNAQATGMNRWNTTKTLGTNIIGGPYRGGNAWGDYAGADINADGLGDTMVPYTSGGAIQTGGDFLPLCDVNLKPGAPSITGENNGHINTPYPYTFTAQDPDTDGLYYYVDWDDGTITDWTGPYPSGQTATLSHTWTKRGTYTIQAQAKDSKGAVSNWGTLTVSMPTSEPLTGVHTVLLMSLLQRTQFLLSQ